MFRTKTSISPKKTRITSFFGENDMQFRGLKRNHLTPMTFFFIFIWFDIFHWLDVCKICVYFIVLYWPASEQGYVVSVQFWGNMPSYNMMTSSNGNIFRVTGHLDGAFTGLRWIPRRPVTQSFYVFFDLHPNKWLSKQLWGRWFKTHSPHYDVTVMNEEVMGTIFTIGAWR